MNTRDGQQNREFLFEYYVYSFENVMLVSWIIIIEQKDRVKKEEIAEY